MNSDGPKKPTHPFGKIIFGKDGTVRRHIEKLPDYKESQERAVAERFVELLRKYQGMDASTPVALAQNDHDSTFKIREQKITLQITEIPPRDFHLPNGTPIKGDPKAIAFFSATSPQGHSLDVDARNSSLMRAISKKLANNYAAESSSKLWLLVFSTSPFLTMEYYEDGQLRIGEPLKTARDHFREKSVFPFDAVWFTNFQGRPTRVLPATGEN